MHQDKTRDGARVDGSLANRDEGEWLADCQSCSGDGQEGQLHHRHGNAGPAIVKGWQMVSPYGWNDEMKRAAKCGWPQLQSRFLVAQGKCAE
jgi:hypothetical protein